MTLLKVGIVILIVSIFFLVTIINLKVKKPEGCDKEIGDASCMGCSLPCAKKDDKK